MPRLALLALLLALVGASCAATPQRPCGLSPDDWCTLDPHDPCSAHRDARSCAADARCVGVAYRGESLVACRYDARGFNGNCPTVGCRSAPAQASPPAPQR